MPARDKRLAPWLIGIFRELNGCLTLEEALHVLIEGTKDLMPHQTIAVLVVNEDTEELLIKTSRNLSYGFVKAFHRRAAGQVVPQVVLRHDRVVRNLLDPSNPEYAALKLEHDFSSVCLAPIIQEHRAIGYLHCDRADGGEFSEDDAAALQVIAGFISLLMEKYQWMILSRHLSRVDEPSGALKYNAFLDEFKRELTRSRTEGKPLSLLMLDVDGYTTFIKEHGIAAGHQLLSELRQLIRSCVREHDLIGRFAADEFIVCMGGAKRTDGEATLEAIRQAVEARAGMAWQTVVTISGTGLTFTSPADFDAPLEKVLTTLGGGMIQMRTQGPNRIGYVDLDRG